MPLYNIDESRVAVTESQLINYQPVRAQRTAMIERALNQLEELYEGAKNGSIKALRLLEDIRDGRTRLYETQSTSDFPALTSELMGRRLRAKFMAYPVKFRSYIPMREGSITNFKNVYSVAVDRNSNSATFGDPIPEGAGFGYSTFKDSNEGYRVFKYIEGYKNTFELRLNDDLGGLAQVVPYMVEDQVFVQEVFAVGLHADASGPLATLYTAGNGNIVTDGATPNPPLSLSSLQAGFELLKSAKDDAGRPIMINGAVLVVGSASLETLAMQIKATLEIRQVEGADTRVSRPALPDFDIVYNPYIDQVVTSNADTSWWLFPRPVSGTARTWAEMGFLQGFDIPQAYMKAPNTMTLAGQLVNQIGDFDTWTQEWAVATAFGGRNLKDVQTTVASRGDSLP